MLSGGVSVAAAVSAGFFRARDFRAAVALFFFAVRRPVFLAGAAAEAGALSFDESEADVSSVSDPEVGGSS